MRLIFITVLFLMASCSKKKYTCLYLENTNSNDSISNLKVYIDQKLEFDGNLKYSKITDNYEEKVLKTLSNGYHNLFVTNNQGISDSIRFEKKKDSICNIFISFTNKKILNKDAFVQKYNDSLFKEGFVIGIYNHYIKY